MRTRGGTRAGGGLDQRHEQKEADTDQQGSYFGLSDQRVPTRQEGVVGARVHAAVRQDRGWRGHQRHGAKKGGRIREGRVWLHDHVSGSSPGMLREYPGSFLSRGRLCVAEVAAWQHVAANCN
jgi:hypothetical protein